MFVEHMDLLIMGAGLSGNSVLNVEHRREGSRHLGPNVTMREVKDGLHDLVFSRPDVRAQMFVELFRWLDGL